MNIIYNFLRYGMFCIILVFCLKGKLVIVQHIYYLAICLTYLTLIVSVICCILHKKILFKSSTCKFSTLIIHAQNSKLADVLSYFFLVTKKKQ